MKQIALPKKIEFQKGKEPNQKLVIIQPCYPGYGITIGNALRRVLLSSLPGAAVIGVKIKGASHEFMALPHIKEDVLEIILNLKQLRLRLHSDEVIKLELDIYGEKKVKAADIKKNSQVEIVNPNLILANITDIAGSLSMEIFVSRGKGYETIEDRESEKHEIGYIEIDSIFSPVVSVGVNVENTRVGKMTNWDKLILNIATDGTITPEEAFKQAAEISIEQFSALIGKPDVKEETEKEEEKEIREDKKKRSKKEKKEKPDEEDKPKKKRGRSKKK
ncbi:MAG: DNA-directed RNA polymerase subunit alpha [Patescibacteria group bacterium]|nr:DNA-directed RNA polymerase subunit alpha [Patescibacteria group bacterium]